MAVSVIRTDEQSTGTATKLCSAISEVEYARFVKKGCICEFQFKFTVSTAITDTREELFSGLPVPLGTFASPFCHDVGSSTSSAVIRLRIENDGILRNGYTPGGIKASQWEGSVVYITKN